MIGKPIARQCQQHNCYPTRDDKITDFWKFADFKQKNSILKESYDSFSNYATQLGAYSLAHNTVYGSNITQGVILLATTDLVFQIFRVKGEKLIEYQNKFLERVEKYYSIVR